MKSGKHKSTFTAILADRTQRGMYTGDARTAAGKAFKALRGKLDSLYITLLELGIDEKALPRTFLVNRVPMAQPRKFNTRVKDSKADLGYRVRETTVAYNNKVNEVFPQGEIRSCYAAWLKSSSPSPPSPPGTKGSPAHSLLAEEASEGEPDEEELEDEEAEEAGQSEEEEED